MDNNEGAGNEGVSLDSGPLDGDGSQHFSSQPPSPMTKFFLRLKAVWRWIVIALLILFLAITGMIGLNTKQNKQASKTVVINTQSLDNGTLNKVTSQLGNNGTVSTQLTIAPGTIFKNSVEVQGKLAADGDLNVGGNVIVKDGGNFGGNLSINGLLTASSLSVGSISPSTITLSGDLNAGGHIVPSGTNPTVKASVAASGGTATVTGNDTAGTVTINIGSGKTVAGELAIITFKKTFATTPKVQLTPVNSASSQLFYYASQSPTFFTINCSAMPVNGASYTFNYLVTQ